MWCDCIGGDDDDEEDDGGGEGWVAEEAEEDEGLEDDEGEGECDGHSRQPDPQLLTLWHTHSPFTPFSFHLFTSMYIYIRELGLREALQASLVVQTGNQLLGLYKWNNY